MFLADYLKLWTINGLTFMYDKRKINHLWSSGYNVGFPTIGSHNGQCVSRLTSWCYVLVAAMPACGTFGNGRRNIPRDCSQVDGIVHRWVCMPDVTSHRDRDFEPTGLVQTVDHDRWCALPQTVTKSRLVYLRYKQQVGYVEMEQL